MLRAIVALQLLLAGVFRVVAAADQPASPKRAAGFLEYMLLAAIAAGVFMVINAAFGNIFGNVIDDIEGALGM